MITIRLTPEGEPINEYAPPKEAGHLIEILASKTNARGGQLTLGRRAYTGNDEVPAGDYIFESIAPGLVVAAPPRPPASEPVRPKVMSPTTMRRIWQRQGAWREVNGRLWRHTADAENFEQFLTSKKDAVQQMGELSIERCVAEKDQHVYESAKQLLLKVYEQLFLGADENMDEIVIWVNKAAGKFLQRPDPILFLRQRYITIEPKDAAKWACGFAEFKKDYQTTKLIDGISRIITCGDLTRQDRNVEELVVPGLVSDGRSIVGVLYFSNANPARESVIVSRIYALASPNGRVRKTDPGFQHVIYFLWKCKDIHMEAEAEAADRVLPPDSTATVVLSGGGSCTVKVREQLAPVTMRGSTYLAEDLVTNHNVILKLSSSPRMMASAANLCLDMCALRQARNEQSILHQIAPCPPSLPQLVAWGTLGEAGSSAAACLHGADALVTKCAASPFASAASLRTPLQPKELQTLTRSLVSALSHLEVHDCWHNDVRKENIVALYGASGLVEDFQLVDLGLAVCRSGAGSDERHFSPVRDLLYSSDEAICGNALCSTSDWQNAAFTLLDLAGGGLPWTSAAQRGACLEVLALRSSFMQRVVTGQHSLQLPANAVSFVTTIFSAILAEKQVGPLGEHLQSLLKDDMASPTSVISDQELLILTSP